MIITTANQKGGVGKTTTGLNICAVLSAVNTPSLTGPADHSPILFVDTDKQVSGAVVVEEAAEAIRKSADGGPPKLSRGTVLNGRNVTTGEPIGLPFDFYHADTLDDIDHVAELAEGYRHVIVDTAGSFDDLTRSERAINLADYVLVPMLAERMSRKPTKRSIDTMIRPRMGDRYGIVIVNYESRNGMADLIDTADWVTGEGYRLLNTVIRSWRFVARNSICTVGKRSTAPLECQTDYLSLAIEITQGA